MDKICHLCGTHYIDDPFLTEHPGHTPQQCLTTLNWRCMELETELRVAKQSLKRAEGEYKK